MAYLNTEKKLAYGKWYRETYPERRKETCRQYLEKNKFRRKISILMADIKYRCENKKCTRFKNYGGRGIKIFLTVSDLINLWNRDKAYLLNKPSIDRKDNNGNYTVGNCKFIEMSENKLKGDIENRIPKELEDRVIETLTQEKLKKGWLAKFSKEVKIDTHSINDWITRKHHIRIKSYNKIKEKLKLSHSCYFQYC